jgi:hypothetical protein
VSIHLACPAGCGWTVPVASTAETWYGRDGTPREFVTGRCRECGSIGLLEPSAQAVEAIAARMAVRHGALRTLAGISPAEGILADGPG